MPNFFIDININPESEIAARERVNSCPWNAVRNSLMASREIEEVIKIPPTSIEHKEKKNATFDE